MAGTLKTRVARLENRPAGGLRTVRIIGGIVADATGEFARAGDKSWTRDDGESPEAFHARAEREAREMGERVLTYGGLPD